MKADLLDFTPAELAARLDASGQPRYRSGQLFAWLYRHRVADFTRMSNLPAAYRDQLAGLFRLDGPTVDARQRAADGTEKYRCRLPDGARVETVLIPVPGRLTICLSTQVGCRFACLFCASGARGFTRDLSAGEIVGQWLAIERAAAVRATNLVFMGMGEPLDNLENTLRALDIICAPAGAAFPARRLTVSTSGLVPGIDRLSERVPPVNLAVSLHAPEQELRARLVPVARKYPLPVLLAACQRYRRRTGRPATLEYALIGGVNDSPRQARRLAAIAGRLGAPVNLIPCNPVPGVSLSPASPPAVEAFRALLAGRGVTVTLRRSRGSDIAAACGQLAEK